MHLHLVFLVVSVHALVLMLMPSQHCLAINPTRRYSYGFNVKDPYGDPKLRRQLGRKKEQISLKPPPEDWPAPTMGPADFLVVEPPTASSISPLHAYQAQLEKEFLEQQRQQTLRRKLTLAPTVPLSVWSSSEDEMKKLLDPNELIKHNKQLRPFINRAVTVSSVGSQGSKPSKTVRSVSKTAAEEERKGVVKKRKNKSKLAKSKMTGKPASRRGRTQKEKEEVDSDSPKSLKEPRKRKRTLKLDSSEKPVKAKKRTKKVKKFTFANYQEGRVENVQGQHRNMTTPKEEVSSLTADNYSVTPSYIFGKTQLPSTTQEGTEECSTVPMEVQTSPTTEVISSTEPVTITEAVSLVPTTIVTTSTPPSTVTCYTVKSHKEEFRDKRKKIRQEMAKVLEREELSPFGDRDSQWRTSETEKVPILNVTPRIALMELLKHKIISYVDKIVRDSPKLTEEEQRLHEKKYTCWNETHEA